MREPSPDGSPAPLATVLSTPLMVALARTVYSDTPDHDPAEPLDIPGKQELAEHLLDNFLPTVYLRARPGARGWDPERVQRWLGHLARHLTESRTPDLAWWRLGHGLRRSTRTLVTALVTGLVIGLVDGVMSVGFSGSVIGGVLDGTIVGLLAGPLFGLVHWFTYTVTGKGLRPSAVRLCTRGRPETTTWRASPRLVIGTLGGALFGCVYGFMVGLLRAFSRHFGLSTALEIELVDANVFGLIFGGAAGLTFCLLETPLDIVSAVSPGSVLRTDRRTVLTQLCFPAPVFGTAVGFGALEALLDRPAGAGDADELSDGRAGRGIGQVVGNLVGPGQAAAGQDPAVVCRILTVELNDGGKPGRGPVVDPRALGTRTARDPLPGLVRGAGQDVVDPPERGDLMWCTKCRSLVLGSDHPRSGRRATLVRHCFL